MDSKMNFVQSISKSIKQGYQQIINLFWSFEQQVFIFYIASRVLREIIAILQVILLLYFLFYRLVHPLMTSGLLCSQIIPQQDRAVFDYLLGQAYQDPDWVRLVQQSLETCQPSKFDELFHFYFSMEKCFYSKHLILSLFQTIYSETETICPLPSYRIHSYAQKALEPFEFDQMALDAIYKSLLENHTEAPFYGHVLQSNADQLNLEWEIYREVEIERNAIANEAERLQANLAILQQQNMALRHQLHQLPATKE